MDHLNLAKFRHSVLNSLTDQYTHDLISAIFDNNGIPDLPLDILDSQFIDGFIYEVELDLPVDEIDNYVTQTFVTYCKAKGIECDPRYGIILYRYFWVDWVDNKLHPT